MGEHKRTSSWAIFVHLDDYFSVHTGRNYRANLEQAEVDHCVLGHDYQEELEVNQSPLPGDVVVDVVQEDLFVEHVDLMVYVGDKEGSTDAVL